MKNDCLRLQANLRTALKAIESTGTFAACTELRSALPVWLYVKGIGDIEMPISQEQIRQLINQAHQIQSALRSKKQELWEIQADQLDFLDPAWQRYVPELSEAIGAKLGVQSPIRLHLEKMLIYGPGAGSEPQTE
ncbi:hypothetical protein MJO29_000730 [Puccinia striiformis f. sp. tritici]|nr:hypothetical protein MJO29_000730 [Puccinia striiformis f. sp. tritici]